MSRPFTPRIPPPGSSAKINGKIRAREVRIIGVDGKQLGIFSLHEAINMARTNGVDLVEIAPNATPPVCRLVDFGKFRYEQAKKEKEARRHQHATKVKEIQLSCSIDQHDMGVKMQHAIDFLCEEMKVKLSLRFRGREMMHKEFGFQVVGKFIQALDPFGHPDAPAKQIGKGITVMLSPLPRNKRAKNPKETGEAAPKLEHKPLELPDDEPSQAESSPAPKRPQPANYPPPSGGSAGSFVNNPFGQLDIKVGQ